MPFLRKENSAKGLRYAKWHKNRTENQWQQVLWRNESSPQHYWSSVGSLTENGTKGSKHPNKSFGKSFKKPGELFLKTTYRNDKKAHLRRCWRLIPNTDFLVGMWNWRRLQIVQSWPLPGADMAYSNLVRKRNAKSAIWPYFRFFPEHNMQKMCTCEG